MTEERWELDRYTHNTWLHTLRLERSIVRLITPSRELTPEERDEMLEAARG